MFSEVELTRMPSVPFTVAHALLMNKRTPEERNPFSLENPREGFYCVNPAQNLPGTEKRFLENMECVLGVWQGACGEPLTRDDFRKFLQSKSLYLYCGHGTGRQHMKEHIELIDVRSVVFLFGCSSGRLKILGTKMDSEGYALRFLLGGSPAVLGNLWDVTDRDIDLFTYHMLRMWLYKFFPHSTSNEPQLGAAVNKTRKECKLRALTGAAPVVYGLPCTSHAT